ncbi:hypothetical protein C0J52_00208 [Blattella germanica]|nr:hypothetical protein C0J52_00208 [Blattella germanica]
MVFSLSLFWTSGAWCTCISPPNVGNINNGWSIQVSVVCVYEKMHQKQMMLQNIQILPSLLRLVYNWLALRSCLSLTLNTYCPDRRDIKESATENISYSSRRNILQEKIRLS